MFKAVSIESLSVGDKFRTVDNVIYNVYEKQEVKDCSNNIRNGKYICVGVCIDTKIALLLDNKDTVYIEVEEVPLCDIKSKGKFILDNIEYIKSTGYGLDNFCCIDKAYNVRFFNAFLNVIPAE